MLKCLRIAFSAACGIICLLLIVFWMRSYTLADICGVTFGGERRTGVASEKCHIFAIILDYSTFARVIGKDWVWDIRTQTIASLYPQTTEEELQQAMDLPKFGRIRFQYRESQPSDGFYRVVVPHWYFILFFATLAAVPWFRWRFSLRTLLIAMTVVAVAVWLISASG